MKEFAKSPTTSQDINNFLDKKFAGKNHREYDKSDVMFQQGFVLSIRGEYMKSIKPFQRTI